MIVLHQGVVCGSIVQLCVEDGTIPVFSLQPVVEEGFLTRVASGVENFVRAHPFVSAYAAYKVYDAVKQYMANKNNTMKLFASKIGDRGKYREMIKELTKQGWYVYNEKFVAGTGYEWTLKKYH